MNSPLGKYAQAVAAVTALGVIAAWILSVFLRGLGIDVDQSSLKEVALIALGAVFGSAATINGVKAPLDSAHSRIDKLESGTGIATHGAYQQGIDGAQGPPGEQGPRGEPGNPG